MADRTPAEIVRLLTKNEWLFGLDVNMRQTSALLACAGAWDREQARQQQTCATCDEWHIIEGNVGECRRTFCYEGPSHSCAAWTAKEPTP